MSRLLTIQQLSGCIKTVRTNSVYGNHIVFQQQSDHQCWREHIDVNRNPDFRHLQRRVLHWCRHAQVTTISRQLHGTDLMPPSRAAAIPQFFIPLQMAQVIQMSGCSGRFSMSSLTCSSVLWSNGNRAHHLLSQWHRCHRDTLNSKLQAPSTESLLCILYILQIKVAADLMVSLMGSPRRIFFRNSWCCSKIFQDDSLVICDVEGGVTLGHEVSFDVMKLVEHRMT